MQAPAEKSLKIKSVSPSSAAKEARKAEVRRELQNKKQCAYQPYECTQISLDGYGYCMKHILNDKNAPFKQCSFVYTTNSKRCPAAAPKVDKKDAGYCNEHALKATLARNRQNCKYPSPQTAEVLLHSLSRYVKKPRHRASSASTHHSEETLNVDESELKATKSLDPFTEIDVASHLNSATDVLDVCSDSESDVEPSVISSVWHDAHADSSDNESVDSEQEDYLKHSNIYSADEITQVTKEKLIRLQSLYIEQYRYLQHMLKEHRRKYLHSLRREKETCCNIHTQVRDNTKEQRLYKKLKAYNKYHRTYGVEAILNKRSHELRAKITEGASARSHNYAKCLFTEGGVKCGERTLPLTKHCRKHILEDQNQVLFRPCGKVRADVECTTPVEAIFDDTTCKLHMDIPCLRSYSQVRISKGDSKTLSDLKDSDSDYEDSLDMSNIQANITDLSTSSNVKTELLDYKLPPEVPKMATVPTQLFEETPESKESNELKTDSEFLEGNSFLNDGLPGYRFLADDAANILYQQASEPDSKNFTFATESEPESKQKYDAKAMDLAAELADVKPEVEPEKVAEQMEVDVMQDDSRIGSLVGSIKVLDAKEEMSVQDKQVELVASLNDDIKNLEKITETVIPTEQSKKVVEDTKMEVDAVEDLASSHESIEPLLQTVNVHQNQNQDDVDVNITS